jgi:hypothetical protein
MMRRAASPEPRRLPQGYPALRELAGAEPGARRALCRGLLRGARLGFSGDALLLLGFAALERWRQGHVRAIIPGLAAGASPCGSTPSSSTSATC